MVNIIDVLMFENIITIVGIGSVISDLVFISKP